MVTASCKPRDTEAPIAREKMTEILTDIHLAETYSTMVWDSVRMVNKHPDSLSAFYNTILQHHGISLDSFSAGMDWYSAHPTELDSVYNSVISNLSTLEGLQSVGSIQPAAD